MAQKSILHYLEQLWEGTGLSLPVAYQTPDEAVAAIRNNLDAGIIPPQRAAQVRAQLEVFEREVHRLTTEQHVSRDQLFGQNVKWSFGSAFEKSAANVSKSVKGGRPLTPFVPQIHPPGRLISSADLPPMPEDFWERFNDIDYRIEKALIAKEGKAYHFDPFYTRLSSLHYEDRVPFLKELRDLRGETHLLNNGLGPEMYRPVVDPLTNKIIASPAGSYRWDPAEFTGGDIDPRAIMLTNSSTRLDLGMVDGLENLVNQYLPSGRQMRPGLIAHHKSMLEQQMKTPGTAYVLDVESAGLDPAEGIWQFAGQMIGPDGSLIGDRDVLHFRNSAMQWKGELGRTRMSIEDKLAQGQNITDYPEGLMDVFNRASSADVIVGHNILFDFGMLSHGITKHPEYRNNPEFKAAADTFMNKFYNPETSMYGQVIDTAVMSRTLLNDITLAPELAGTDTGRFSLQNILLQTNLLEHVRNAEGPDVVNAWLEKGLHYADVDVPMESHLYNALKAGTLDMNVDEHGRGRVQGWWRSRILHSSPIAPGIHISDFKEHINDDLVEKLMKAGLVNFDLEALEAKGYAGVEDLIARGITTKEALEGAGVMDTIRGTRLSPLEQKVLMSRDLSLPFNDPVFMRGGGTLAEQFSHTKGSLFKRLKQTMWDASPLPDRDLTELAYHAGTWRRISNKFTTKAGTIRKQEGIFPTSAEWEAIQWEHAEKGIPFSGLSMVEKHLMAQINTAVGPGLNPGEQMIRKLYGGDFGLGRWMGSDELGVTSSNLAHALVKIPEQYLIEAEKDGVFNLPGGKRRTGFSGFEKGERTELYELSPFSYRGGKEVGLTFKFGEGDQGAREKDELIKFLKGKIGSSGFENLTAEQIALAEEALGQNASAYGMQVATFGRVGKRFMNKRAAADLHDSLVQIMGGEVNRGNSNLTTVHVARVATDFNEPGIVSTAAAIIKPEMMSDQDMAGVVYHAHQLVRLEAEKQAKARNNPMIKFLDTFAEEGVPSKYGMKIAQGYIAAKRKAPLVAIAGAITGGLYLRHRADKRNTAANQVLDYQPTENDDYYNQYQDSLGIPQTRIVSRNNYTNPLSTAGLIKRLDQRKVNHTNMSSDRYGYLFSGGYS